MGKMLGYMITWTTYGTWLQGDKRGYVKDGKIYKKNPQLEQKNKEQQASETVKLTNKQQCIVQKAVLEEACKLGQKVYSVAVFSNHVHLVVGYISDPIREIVGYYKNATRVALQKEGFVGRVWTRGYDKRYCFDEKSLRARVDYVKGHD